MNATAAVKEEAAVDRNGSSSGPVEREYNGHPVLTLNPQSKFPFSFGPAKAEMILRSLDAIRAFAAKYQESAGERSNRSGERPSATGPGSAR